MREKELDAQSPIKFLHQYLAGLSLRYIHVIAHLKCEEQKCGDDRNSGIYFRR